MAPYRGMFGKASLSTALTRDVATTTIVRESEGQAVACDCPGGVATGQVDRLAAGTPLHVVVEGLHTQYVSGEWITLEVCVDLITGVDAVERSRGGKEGLEIELHCELNNVTFGFLEADWQTMKDLLD